MGTSMPALEAVIIEDEDALRKATAQTLELGAFKVYACSSAEQAQPWLHAGFGGVIVTDVRLPGRSGLEVLAQVVALDPDLPVIVVTGHGDVSMAVEAMRSGAYDFIEKPFAAERLMETARRAQEKRSLVLENRRLKAAWAAHPDMPALIGQSAATERVRTMIRSLGPSTVDILINGQTGTGKEVVARQLHIASGRKGPFVAIRKRYSKARSSVMKQAHSRVRRNGASASSNMPGAERSSSTKSKACRWRCRSSCCACCRSGAWNGWAATRA